MSNKFRVLLVDDERPDSETVTGLRDAGIEIEIEQWAENALESVQAKHFDAVLLDLIFPPGQMDGEELLKALRQHHKDLPVVILTQVDSLRKSKALQKSGAWDYVLKRPEEGLIFEEVAWAIERAVRAGQMRRYISRNEASPGLLVANSRKSRDVKKRFGMYLLSPHPVVIFGEPGTGKRFLAAELHRGSSRFHAGDLVPFDAREPALADRLFGASRYDIRITEGTLLIENAHLLPSPLLRRLERADLHGGRLLMTSPVRPDQNQTLFRRCQLISLPRLNERVDDIPDLARFFLKQHDAAHSLTPHQFDDAVLELLKGREYPFNNVAELQQTVEDAALRASDSVIRVSDVPPPSSEGWDVEHGLHLVLNKKLSWLQFLDRHMKNAEIRMANQSLQYWDTYDRLHFDRYGERPTVKDVLGPGEKENTLNKRRSRNQKIARKTPA